MRGGVKFGSFPGRRAELISNGAGSRRAGEWFWIGGERRFVPTTDEFIVRIDGVTFRSPPGTLDIYRDDTLICTRGEPSPHHHDLDPPGT